MSPSEAPRRPNILHIMDDQHRFDYLGCAGASFLRTPAVDRIAARGVRFTRCYTNAPICAPARIGLAAGLQPWRMGSVGNDSFLPRRVTTFYQRLRDHGYRVGCVGKLDLAKPDNYNGRHGDRPCVYGWGFTHPEETEGKMHAGSRPEPLGPYGFYLQERGLYKKFHQDYAYRSQHGWIVGVSHDSVLPTEHFEDAYIGRRAARWIEQIPDDFPWYYFVSFVGPHDPFDPPTEYADRYRDAVVPEPISDEGIGKPGWICNRMRRFEPEEVALTRRQYCGAIELIDDQVGLMLQALERRGMLENTCLIFTSDHGEMLGDHGLYTKHVGYEASSHVPLCIAGPRIEEGRTSEALVELIDLNPTICELAGLAPQEDIDARSLSPLLMGEAHEHRSDVVFAERNYRAICTGRHKLIENYNNAGELYDLEEDPEELHNLTEREPDLARKLGRRLGHRFLEGKWLR